jgi:hypothetical protein
MGLDINILKPYSTIVFTKGSSSSQLMTERHHQAIVDLLENHRLSLSPENRFRLTCDTQTTMDAFRASPSYHETFEQYPMERIMTSNDPEKSPDPYRFLMNLESDLLALFANGVLLDSLDGAGDIVADQKALQRFNQATLGNGVPLADAFVIPLLERNIEQLFAQSPPKKVFKVRHEASGNLKNLFKPNGKRYYSHKLDMSEKLSRIPYMADHAPILFSVPQDTKIPSPEELGVPVKVLEYPLTPQEVQGFLMDPMLDTGRDRPSFPVVFAKLPLTLRAFKNEYYKTAKWKQLIKAVSRECQSLGIYSDRFF